MSDQKENEEPDVNYEGGVPVIRRLSEIERKQAEAERRDQRYKDDQIALDKSLVDSTERLVYATRALVVATIVMGIIGGIQLWYIHRQWKLASDGLSKMGDQIWVAKNAGNAAQDAANAARRAADTAKDALVRVQRAFVFADPVEARIVGKRPETGALNVNFRWENTGTTPTKWMRFKITCIWFDTGLPKNFSFPELIEKGKREVHPLTVIPPRGAISAFSSVPVGIVNRWNAGFTHIYFYGWAKYRDVFSGTPEHITKFCYEMVKVQEPDVLTPPTAPGISNVTFSMTQCPRNNCYDEQCGDK